LAGGLGGTRVDNEILRTKADTGPTSRRGRKALSLPDRSDGKGCALARHGLGIQKRSLLSRWRWVAVFCVAALTTTCLSVVGDPLPAAAAGCAPRQVSVAPDTGLNNLFQNYGNSGTGKTWTGGDGTESVSLPDGRVLWLFDDSFLGKVINGQRNRRRTPYIHNAFVVQSNGVLTTTLYTPGRKRQKPSAYVNPDPKNTFSLGFFPGASVVNGNSLQVLMEEVGFTKIPNHVGNFTWLGDSIGVFSLPNLALVEVAPLPSSSIEWTSGTLSDAGFTYIYGTGTGNVYAARVAGTDLTAAWTYYNGQTWTTDASRVVPIEHAGDRTHLSVSKVAGSFGTGYAFVTGYTQVVSAFGCSPIGPFGSQQAIYTPPEPSTYPHSYGVITYNAHAHPELSPSSNTLVISYDVNPAVPKGLAIPDASIYRPRFIDVTLH
jgi:hypothetical protein